jgi:small subunit ribosomal protein S19e
MVASNARSNTCTRPWNAFVLDQIVHLIICFAQYSPNYFFLYEQMEVPQWVDIVKTATFKEHAPYDPDWFYIRAASTARKIYVHGRMGVGALRKSYSGSKNNGHNKHHRAIGSGSVARAVLKQLESLGVIEKDGKGGRVITASGMRDLDRIAGRVKVDHKMI